MAKAPPPAETSNNILTFTRRKKAPELALDIRPPVSATPPATPAAYTIPAGKPKLLMAIGSGQTGKSTLLRWVAERSLSREGTALATLAPNRTLLRYFEHTIVGESNSTSAGVALLEGLIEALTAKPGNLVIDFPGDDTSLPHLLDQGMNPVEMLERAGVEVVALYTLSPRTEDLTAMAQLVAKGFTPKATALILNTGLTADPTMPAVPEFDQIVDHSTYRAAIERGCAEVWMPRLFSAKIIEDYHLLFQSAMSSPDVGPGNQSRTHHWLRAMDEAFTPIASWLP